jgi:hypothetical protein
VEQYAGVSGVVRLGVVTLPPTFTVIVVTTAMVARTQRDLCFTDPTINPR